MRGLTGFEDDDPLACALKEERGGDPGDPRAHDHDVDDVVVSQKPVRLEPCMLRERWRRRDPEGCTVFGDLVVVHGGPLRPISKGWHLVTRHCARKYGQLRRDAAPIRSASSLR